ncbi:MAG: DUF6293 family protein [Methanomassiliicoccus sp.]|nr:DUF6293 family protein [Methanomassiliicoccus sp.]
MRHKSSPCTDSNKASKKGLSAINGLDGPSISPRLRVVISCMSYETLKVVKPIGDLRAEKIYLICWNGIGSNRRCSVFSDFYDEIVKRLHNIGFEADDIVVRRIDVYQFKKVMGELMSIMSRERGLGNDVYVNLSSGTMEYVAAATVASMMVDGVKPFIVHSQLNQNYVTQLDELYHSQYIQFSKKTELTDPVELPSFRISPPPRDLVIALRRFRIRRENKLSTKYAAMIQDLKEAGVWTYDGEAMEKFKATDSRRDKLAQAEKMYYSRHFIDGWIRQGWVDGKNGRGSELRLTDSGENVTDIFYLDA